MVSFAKNLGGAFLPASPSTSLFPVVFVRPGSRLVATLLVLGASSRSIDARAQAPAADLDSQLSLEWVAPAECPGDITVRSHVRTLVEDGAVRRRVRARATVSREGGQYVLVLVIDDRAPRTLTNEECTRLSDAAAVILALDLETPDEATSERPPAPPPVEPEAPEIASTAPKKGTAELPPPLRAGVQLQTLLDVGSLPQPTGAYRIGLRVERGLWSGALIGTAFIPRDADGANPGTGAHVRLLTGGLKFCRSFAVGRGHVALGACLGGEAGESTVEGFGISRPITSSAVSGAAFGGPELRIRWTPQLVLVAGLEAVASIRASRVTIEGTGVLFEPSRALFRAGIGIEFVFFQNQR